MSLKSLPLKTSYHKGVNDIADEFYLPCMYQAIKYDRAVGFFSSTVYAIAWSALKDFVRRGGKMRIICSRVLSSADIDALEKGYEARIEKEEALRITEEIAHLLAKPELEVPTTILASLVALGAIELRIAFIKDANLPDQKRIFHDKLGIFTDVDGTRVAFKGSMNETWYGLANDGNLESVDVYLSWADIRERSRVAEESTYFELLWDNQYPSVTVKPFPEVARRELIQAANLESWEKLTSELSEKIEAAEKTAPAKPFTPQPPRPHQTKALAAWKQNGRRGIFKHITGSGKTFTALLAIRDALAVGEVVIIFVPSDYLLYQWEREMLATLGDLDPWLLLCGGGNTAWREKQLLSLWTRKKISSKPRIVLSTLQTASSEDFVALLHQGEHLFLVVDEVHRIGSPKFSRLLTLITGPRLGLSGTPERAGDPVGTQLILDYFNGIVPPPFTLEEAIPDVLTPYFYYVHTVTLAAQEQEEWTLLTNKISRLYAQQKNVKPSGSFDAGRMKLMLIQRSRIVKSAQAKIIKTIEIMFSNFKIGQRWILYCDTLEQVRQIVKGLREKGLPAIEYHSQMEGDRDQTIRIFESNGGILVSIHCLDEGVDIPAVTHALILASSKNPREFIQRRGRVLRKTKGKNISYVHDLLVLPVQTDEEDPNLSIIKTEIARDRKSVV